ncbi:ATP-binding protein [Paenibacillus chartarius]|uniref:histidine kinase n=1 Tax=Paenibacillus chartarius TaxID=747481 RepID=A0ABV6DRS0_9BACL
MFKDLMLQVLTILLPILTIQIVFLRSNHFALHRRYSVYIGLLSGLASVLCMSFPLQFAEGFQWDFRWIPIMIATLYGGYPAGIISVVMSIVFRTYLGGPAAMFSLVGAVLTMIVPLMLAARFRSLSRLQRYGISAGAAMLAFVYVMLNMVFYLTYIGKLSVFPQYAGLFALAGGLQLALTLLAVFMIEHLVEIAKLRSSLQRTEQLVAVSELAASVTHEVRNPLTVVRGFLQLAKSSVDPKVTGYMDTAISELDRAEFIISDYLSLAKPQVERLETIDLKEKLSGIASLMHSFAAMRGVSLLLDLQIGLKTYNDSVKLGQVVMNLVKNAIEAVQENGEVRIRSYLRKEYIVIEVADNGEGMTPEQLRRLGTTYYTTKERGTGLGTMVAFRVIEAMGGKLEYASVRGEGTTAYILLPAAPGGT